MVCEPCPDNMFGWYTRPQSCWGKERGAYIIPLWCPLTGKVIHPMNGLITQRHSGPPFSQGVKNLYKTPGQRNPICFVSVRTHPCGSSSTVFLSLLNTALLLTLLSVTFFLWSRETKFLGNYYTNTPVISTRADTKSVPSCYHLVRIVTNLCLKGLIWQYSKLIYFFVYVIFVKM
jgi:hypothetical protein